MILCDPSAERAVLSGILKYGEDAYLDICDIVQEETFTIDSNQVIYKCIKNICDKNPQTKLDLASIYSSAQELQLSHILSQKEESQHLKAVFDFPVNLENVRKFAAKIKKLEIARLLHKELENVQEQLLDVTGSENISSIIGIAEESIFNFASSLSSDGDSTPSSISKGIDDYIKFLCFVGEELGLDIPENITKQFKDSLDKYRESISPKYDKSYQIRTYYENFINEKYKTVS
jgi:replicative DNA helicase